MGYVKYDTNLDHPNLNLADPDKGKKWMTMQFQLSVGEKIHGLGERSGSFIKNGQTVDMWNEDSGTSSELTYKNVPFYISSGGYGIFVTCPGAVSKVKELHVSMYLGPLRDCPSTLFTGLHLRPSSSDTP